MQASAPPNRVCISNETARLVCDADGNVLRANLALECAPKADAAAAISLPLPAVVVRIGSDRDMPCAVVAQGGANSWLARDRNAPLAWPPRCARPCHIRRIANVSRCAAAGLGPQQRLAAGSAKWDLLSGIC
jgi:hypothetical protein